MFYVLVLMICLTFSSLIESALIYGYKRKAIAKAENLFNGYMSSLLKLSDVYPDREIEFQLQFDVPEPTTYNPLKMKMLRALKAPKIKRLLRDDTNDATKLVTIPTTTQSSTPTTETPASTAPSPLTTPPSITLKTEATTASFIQMEDLKKAIEDFEKKISETDCPGYKGKESILEDQNLSNCSIKDLIQLIKKENICGYLGQTTSQQQQFPLLRPNRGIQEALSFIGKGFNLQFNVPKPTNSDMKWLQIKVPES